MPPGYITDYRNDIRRNIMKLDMLINFIWSITPEDNSTPSCNIDAIVALHDVRGELLSVYRELENEIAYRAFFN